MTKRTFGWKRPTTFPDPAKSYRLNRGVHPILPSSYEQRPIDTPILDQADLGACTGFGWAAALRFRDQNILKIANPSASELFIYYNERSIEGSTADDAGAAVSDGAKVVHQLGCCSEEDWPYDTTKYAFKPPLQCYSDALHNTVPEPLNLNNADLDEVKSALYEKQLVVFGFEPTESFYDVGMNGVYRPRGQIIGGHCVCVISWYPGWMVCRNSWGPGWGADGYFFMANSLFTSSNVTDCWTIPSAA